MGRSNSISPVRAGRPPRKKSPSRRQRSPARHRSSNVEKGTSHNRSPKRERSRSPMFLSQVRDKPIGLHHSPKREESPSTASLSSRKKSSSRTRSPKHARSRSPALCSSNEEKLPSRTRSLTRSKGRSSMSRSPRKEMLSNHSRSPEVGRSKSPSPRSKRLERAKAARNAERGSERQHKEKYGSNGDGATHKERESNQTSLIDRKDKRQGRYAIDNGSSKLGHRLSASPSRGPHRSQHRSRSPSVADVLDEMPNSRDTDHRNGDNDSLTKMKAAEKTLEAKEKQKPSFELSGKLAAETNRFRGITLLFNEPSDARKPDIRWRLYVFKGGEVLNEPLYVHRQSCYLFGRERRVADIPTDHPSCSKQHAVLQYRQVNVETPDGSLSKKVRPYLMDLGSTNGTFINDNQIEPQRYYELFEKDTMKFGNSSREYVLLHENSTE